MQAVIVVACVSGLALSGCVAPNPKFCDALEDCANGLVCDLETNSCVPPPDPPDVECSDQIPCADPLKPICSPDQVCQACVLDDECGSQVCRTDGSCELADNILYAAADGVSSGLCPVDAPCDLSFAWSLVDATRTTIRLLNGAYTLATDFETSNVPVTVVGGRGAMLARSSNGPAFEALNGTSLTLRGFVLNNGVSCLNASLVVTNMVFDNPTAELRPWISGSRSAQST